MLPTARSAMKRFPSTTLIFRLYELLKNNSRFFRIAGASGQSGSLRQQSMNVKWWRMTGSNRRPPACKAGALPAELIPRSSIMKMVGLVGLEPTTPALSRRCSNQLSYRPFTFLVRSRLVRTAFSCATARCWRRMAGSRSTLCSNYSR